MDIKELKKLISEVKQERKVLKNGQDTEIETLLEAKFARFVAKDTFNKSLFDKEALDILFNVLASENLPQEMEGARNSLLQNAQEYKDLFGDLPSYFKKLDFETENKKRNAMLAYKLFSPKSGRTDLSSDPERKRQLFAKLKSPNIKGSIEGILHIMNVEPEDVQDFMFHLNDMAVLQPKTNPGTPSAKSQEVSPTADTRKPQPVTGVNKPNPISGLNSIPPQYRQKPGSTKAE
jgi:hypothetical protein